MAVNDEQVEVHPKFKLYMATKQNNPNFSPQVFLYTNVINFLVTEEALQEKLLADIFLLENPDNDQIKKDLMNSIQDDRLRNNTGSCSRTARIRSWTS